MAARWPGALLRRPWRRADGRRIDAVRRDQSEPAHRAVPGTDFTGAAAERDALRLERRRTPIPDPDGRRRPSPDHAERDRELERRADAARAHALSAAYHYDRGAVKHLIERPWSSPASSTRPAART